MKTVVSNDMVAHLWAHQSQSEARNDKGSFYFRDSVIYSYGPHFPIARHVNGVVLQTTASYSITTNRHKFIVAQACSHLTVYNVPDVLADSVDAHVANLADYQACYEAAILRASRARISTEWHIKTANRLFAEGNAYAEKFFLSARMVERDTAELLDRAKAQAAAAREADKARLAERREMHDREWSEFQEALPTWRIGLIYRLPALSYDNPHKPKGALLRIIDDTVSTSRGAEFPVSAAPLAWRIVKRCKDAGTAWQSNGEQVRLGHFRLDSVDTAGNVRAGCHYVEYAECEWLARTLNL